jgi:hypothetical protein
LIAEKPCAREYDTEYETGGKGGCGERSSSWGNSTIRLMRKSKKAFRLGEDPADAPARKAQRVQRPAIFQQFVHGDDALLDEEPLFRACAR